MENETDPENCADLLKNLYDCTENAAIEFDKKVSENNNSKSSGISINVDVDMKK